jgi:UDP-hydrolysing UDP-N-acetyl-D-glucosamine 2-epimerase
VRRKICLVTTSRADFGLLSGLAEAIASDKGLRLQLIVSGMHLPAQFGSTWREIAEGGFAIDYKVDMGMRGRSDLDNLQCLSKGLRGFSEGLAKLRPDILVLLGDRFELLAPAIAALMLHIPMAHIHGGELSEGAIDDSVRHAITKFASIHFPATEVYRRRIIQMGESPALVFNLGAPGLDWVYRTPLATKEELERDLHFSLSPPVALVTYHPETRGVESIKYQIEQLIHAIDTTGIRAVFTMANADTGGQWINYRLQKLCKRTPDRFKWVPHLGHVRYLSCLKHFSIMVGNSSSGLTEAPSFRLPVVNIGDRQRGRVRAANVIDVPCSEEAIIRGIRRGLSPRFRQSLRSMRNPYDRFRDGSTSERMKDVLKSVPLSPELLKKCFHDLT